MNVDKDYVLTLAETLIGIDSPIGFTNTAMAKVEELTGELGLKAVRSSAGAVQVHFPGKDESTFSNICSSIGTMGLMVRSITESGRLNIVELGNRVCSILVGEYCRIYTREGEIFTGTVVSKNPIKHFIADANSWSRKAINMEICIDEIVHSKSDVLKLGISTGDFICIDPKFEVTPAGFIKSRFLNDKLSVAILFGFVKYLVDNRITPIHNLKFIFSNYDKMGHSTAWLPERESELIAVGSGCVGDDSNCSEYDVSICAAYSGRPYDYNIISRLVGLAQENSINYTVDVYHMSDVCEARRAEYDIAAAVIGPGVSASHNIERCHYQAVEATIRLLAAYFE